jgi:hypothetical protein
MNAWQADLGKVERHSGRRQEPPTLGIRADGNRTGRGSNSFCGILQLILYPHG